MNIEIRKSTLEDIEKGLLDVYIEGYKYHQKGRPDIFTDASNEELKKELTNYFNSLSILVLLENNTIVGYLSYKIKNNHSKKIKVDQLIISEKYRNKGYGKQLMNEVKKIAEKEKCTRIELDCWLFNKNALAMYEHIGFKKQRIIFEMNLKN